MSCGGLESLPVDEGHHDDSSVRKDRHSVAALGRVEPEDGFIRIATGLPDRVSSILVKEGDRVDGHSVLLILESHDERRRAVELVRTQLSEARRRHQRDGDFARAKLSEARVALDRARRVPPLEVKACQAEVERLQIQREEARRNLHRFEALAKRNSVSASEKERYETAFKEVGKALEAAVTRLQEARVQETTQVAEAEHRVKTAEAALARALDSDNIEELEKQLALAETRLAQTVIRAPAAAEVLQVFARPGEAAAGRPLLLLGDTQRLCVVAEVDETDAGLVRNAQRVRVSSRALSGELTGSVESVGHVILRNDLRDLDPAARTDRRVVEVRILLDEPEMARRFLNLQVDVEILTDQSFAEAS